MRYVAAICVLAVIPNRPLGRHECMIVRPCLFRDQHCGLHAMPSVGAGWDDEISVRTCRRQQPQRHAAAAATHATPCGEPWPATAAA